MSTLVVTSLRHTSSSSNNVVLDSGGNATFAANTSVAGNLLFNSGFGSAAIAYGCRAWVNFNGTGTVAIRRSGNVSSITDNGVGDYTVNFAAAMPDADYAACALYSAGINGNGFHSAGQEYTTTTFRFRGARDSGNNLVDTIINAVAIFR